MLSKLVPVTYQAEFLFLGVEEKKKKKKEQLYFSSFDSRWENG